jgi:hypothetical protein
MFPMFLVALLASASAKAPPARPDSTLPGVRGPWPFTVSAHLPAVPTTMLNQ